MLSVPDNEVTFGVVDSGCTILSTGLKHELSNIEKTANPVKLAIANGMILTSEAVGMIGPLKAVYFKELGDQTLISVSQLARLGYEVKFTVDTIEIVEKRTQMVCVTGVLRNKLYLVNIDDLRNLEQAFLTRQTISIIDPVLATRNHNRCSHVGIQMIEYASKHGLCDGLNTNVNDFNKQLPLCVICGKAKAKRLPLRRLKIQHFTQLKVGTKLQIDMQGPMQIPSLGGDIYCTLGLDYHSDKTFIAFHATKDRSYAVIEYWMTHEYLANNHLLSVIKCDNDSVYMSNDFRSLCHSKGIKFEYSQAYNPEQNSRIEKRFEYIDGLGRANLLNYQAIWNLPNPPIKLWHLAFKYAIYISDRIRPSYLDQNISAHEAFTGQKPNLSTAVPFGTLGICPYVDIIPRTKMQKLDDRGFEGIFVGVDTEHSPGYRLMTKTFPPQIFTCRNVKFDLHKNDHAMFRITQHHDDFSKESITADNLINISTEYDAIERSCNTDSSNAGSDIDHATTDQVKMDVQPEVKSIRTKKDHNIPYREPYKFRQKEEINHNYAIMDSNLKEEPTIIKLIDPKYIYTPKSLKDALKCADAEMWRRGAISEVQSQFDKGTHKRVKLPQGAKAIQSKWIFKVKVDNNNNIKYKVRLVAQGQTQIYGIDFDETYSPVARLETTRAFFALATQYDWIIHQMDVDTA
jgi:hypothetical protein